MMTIVSVATTTAVMVATMSVQPQQTNNETIIKNLKTKELIEDAKKDVGFVSLLSRVHLTKTITVYDIRLLCFRRRSWQRWRR